MEERRKDYAMIVEHLKSFSEDIKKDVKESIKEVKEDIDTIKCDVNSINVKLSSMKTFEDQVKDHEKAIYGNGKPGLIDSFNNYVVEFVTLKTRFNIYLGIASTVGGLIGSIVTVIIYNYMK